MSRLLFILILSILTCGFVVGDPTEIKDLKAKFENTQDRSEYLSRLADLREQYVSDQRNNDAFAVDAEVLNYPLPSNVDGKVLSQQRAGKWRSPRHDYLYRKDGTWTMLPIANGITHGRWRIEGNQYFDWVPSVSSQKPVYTIILLDSEYFIFVSGKSVFYERRLKANSTGQQMVQPRKVDIYDFSNSAGTSWGGIVWGGVVTSHP